MVVGLIFLATVAGLLSAVSSLVLGASLWLAILIYTIAGIAMMIVAVAVITARDCAVQPRAATDQKFSSEIRNLQRN